MNSSPLTKRDALILTKAIQFECGTPLHCAVCGASAPLTEKEAGASAFLADSILIVYPLCAEHNGTAPSIEVLEHPKSATPALPALDKDTQIAAYGSYIRYMSSLAPCRYIVIHPLSCMVPAEYAATPFVVVVDTDTKDFLGMVPAPLHESEIDSPLWCGTGEFAAECLEALTQLREGKREYHLADGMPMFVFSDEAPKRIENPRRGQ